jgi:phytoene desaturase
MSKKVVIIGSGIGGIALGIRLQAMGFETIIVEKLDKPGGRAYQKEVFIEGIEGSFKFDMGPTVLTVPHFIEELFALQKPKIQNSNTISNKNLNSEIDLIQNNFKLNFPQKSLEQFFQPNLQTKTKGLDQKPNENQTSPTFSETNYTKDYIKIIPILPFYRIYFEDKTFFDYDGDFENTKSQILSLTKDSKEAEAYEIFHKKAREVFEIGFLELGFKYFKNPQDMFEVLPKMLKLKVVQGLFGYIKKYFKHPKTQFIFSFEPLLIGGNPTTVPALYVMIHFVEKTWGIHYAIGGTGALIDALILKFEELGGKLKLNSEVSKILIEENPNQFLENKLRKIQQKLQNYPSQTPNLF